MKHTVEFMAWVSNYIPQKIMVWWSRITNSDISIIITAPNHTMASMQGLWFARQGINVWTFTIWLVGIFCEMGPSVASLAS